IGGGQFSVDQRREGFSWHCAYQSPSVDVESRRAVNPQLQPRLVVALDLLCVFAAVYTSLERLHIQIQLLGVGQQIIFRQLGLLLEKQIVIFPEFLLLVGAFSRFSRTLRKGVNTGDREIPIDKADFAFVFLQQGRQCLVVEPLAERTLEVAELNHGDRRVLRANGRIAFRADRETLIRVFGGRLLRLGGYTAGIAG